MKWIHLIAPIAQVQLAPSLQWCASLFLKLIFTFCKFPSVRRIRLVSEQKISELPSCGLLLRQRAICNIFCQDVSLFSKSMRVNDCLSKNKPEMRIVTFQWWKLYVHHFTGGDAIGIQLAGVNLWFLYPFQFRLFLSGITPLICSDSLKWVCKCVCKLPDWENALEHCQHL